MDELIKAYADMDDMIESIRNDTLIFLDSDEALRLLVVKQDALGLAIKMLAFLAED